MTDFLTADTSLPSYMMFPRFLLDMEINETAKMLYMILLDRARLSQKNEGWSDTNGHVFPSNHNGLFSKKIPVYITIRLFFFRSWKGHPDGGFPFQHACSQPGQKNRQ